MKLSTTRNMPMRKCSFTAGLLALVVLAAAESSAATVTWDGGGVDGLTSTAANWVGDVSPAATGDSLVFAGTTNLGVINDSITSLGSNSFNFAAGAGGFTVSGNQMVVGNSAGNDNFVTKVSTTDQTISAPIKLVGGQRDRTIVMTGGGTLTLSGNLDFSNDWLFPTTAAGTIVLSGNNTGDGKGSVINAGTNTMRAVLRNNIANTTLTLGSNSALGNASPSGASLRGMVANQNLTLNTIGDRSLSGSALAINTGNVTYNSADNLTLGYLLNQGGNRDFWVTGAGNVSVANNLWLSVDQTGRNLYVRVDASGQMIVDGMVGNTFHSGGITTGSSRLRKAGSGTMQLNANSGTTFSGLLAVEAGTLRFGAAGSVAGAANVDLWSGGTLDVSAVSGFAIPANQTLGGGGAVVGDVTIEGAHSPGTISTTAIVQGIQTFSNDLSYAAGAGMNWELFANSTGIPGTDFDRIDANGDLTFSGPTAVSLRFNASGSTVAWSDSFWDSDRSWLAWDLSTGTLTGFGNASLTAQDWLDASGATLSSVRPNASFSLTQVGQDVAISFTAVPEPTVVGLVMMGAAVASSCWLRRSGRSAGDAASPTNHRC